MSDDNDPRVYFAAERTLLAWLRTGLAVVGLGFLVARFGLFLAALRQAGAPANHLESLVIGAGFVLLGTLMVGIASWQHTRFCRKLTAAQRPEMYSVVASQIIGWIVCGLCALLAVYLVTHQPQ